MILATFSVPQVLNYNLSPGETAHPLELVDLKMEADMWALIIIGIIIGIILYHVFNKHMDSTDDDELDDWDQQDQLEGDEV